MIQNNFDQLVIECTQQVQDIDADVIENLCKDLIQSTSPFRGSVAHGLIIRLIVEAAKAKMTSDQLQETLNASKASFTDAVVNTYQNHRDQLIKMLETIGYRYPNVVETNWKLSGLMESNAESRIKAPVAELTVKSLPAGKSQPENYTFTCTKDELLDLQKVIREAENMLSKLSQKS
uniref:COMM domain-containing protein 3 n=1 Tax=Panagrolaimus sp. JU765 TaxID=591449 RepID=A0AC34QUK6_9BILA